MRRTAAFLVGLLAGLLLAWYVIPFFLSEKNIYDKLRDAHIPINEDNWYVGDLQRARYIEQLRNFEQFQQFFKERYSSRGAHDSIHVCVDSDWNVVWLEVWKEDEPTDIEYLGFYLYSEAWNIPSANFLLAFQCPRISSKNQPVPLGPEAHCRLLYSQKLR